LSSLSHAKESARTVPTARAVERRLLMAVGFMVGVLDVLAEEVPRQLR